MTKGLIKKAAAFIAVFSLPIAAATYDRHDQHLQVPQVVADLAEIEAQERQALEEWHKSMQRIEAERVEYEAALEAALLARREAGDFGEVLEP